MHKSVNEIHCHPSDSFETFSTGARRPRIIYLEPGWASRRLRGTLFYSFEMFGKHLSMFYTRAHPHAHTHRQLPRLSKDRHRTSRGWRYINEETVKTNIDLFTFENLVCKVPVHRYDARFVIGCLWWFFDAEISKKKKAIQKKLNYDKSKLFIKGFLRLCSSLGALVD